MKNKMIKVIIIISAIVLTLTIGFGIIRTTDIYKKYKLADIAKSKGYTHIEVGDDYVTFWTDESIMTYYAFDYGVKELSGK